MANSDPRPAPPTWARGLIFFAVAYAAAWLLYGSVAADGPVGWDAYPLLASVHADGGGVISCFTDELMGGRYPDGRFYRPLTSLSFLASPPTGAGIVSGTALRPVDLFACALAAMGLGLLCSTIAERLGQSTGRARWSWLFAGLAASLVYVGHPSQLDIIPFAPRRADGLCAAFMALGVYLAYSGAKPWALGLATLAAVLSKETGVIAVPLIFAATLAREDTSPREALLACAVPAGALLLAIIARFAVLGELGGHTESGAFTFTAAANTASAMGRALMPGSLLAAGLLVGFVLFRTWGLAGATGRALWVPVAWAVLALLITSFSGRVHEWYAIALVPSLATLVGISIGAGWAHGYFSGIGITFSGLALAALVGRAAADTHLKRESLDFASEVSLDQSQRFQAAVTPLQAGDTVAFGPFYPGASKIVNGAPTPPVFVQAPYSLSALAELIRSDLKVQVDGQGLNALLPVSSPKATVVLSAPFR